MASPRVDPADWHVPTLDEVFDLAAAYPGGPIFLDTKLPPGEDEVARRMGEQYLAAFTRQPALRGRAFIACPDAGQLAVMQEVFAADPAFADFRDFALDHEELSGFVLGHDVDEATPLRGAGDNRWLSIGAAYKPLAVGGFDDLLTLVGRTLERTRRPGGVHAGKRLCVWTIDDEAQMEALARLAPDVILTNLPDRLHAVLDRHFGRRGADPARPLVMCHRGGPDGHGRPENTLPLLELGLTTGDAIELDVCSATDGAVVLHDNDPEGAVTVLRRAGGGVGEFKPVYRGPRALADRRMDQLTVAEIQASHGYARDEKGALASVATGLRAVAQLVKDAID